MRHRAARVRGQVGRTAIGAAILALASALSGVAPVAAQMPWSVTAYEVAFEIRNAGLPVTGSFAELEAVIDFDPNDPAAARIEGFIDPASIETGIALRDRHLQGRQFFDVARFPRISMRSDAMEAAGAGEFRGTFVLTIRDVENRVPVTFRFRRDGADRAEMSGSMRVNRVDYGIGDAGFILADDITIDVTLRLASAGGVEGLQ